MSGSKANRWVVLSDAAGQWRWEERSPDQKLLQSSARDMANFTDCIQDAIRHGYPVAVLRRLTDVR